MQRVSFSAMFAAAVVVTCLLLFATSATAQNSRISGYVTDTKNKPIQEIEVMVFRGIVNIASAKTDRQGNYTIDYRPGKAVTVLFNGNTDWLPERVKNVVGTNNINMQ